MILLFYDLTSNKRILWIDGVTSAQDSHYDGNSTMTGHFYIRSLNLDFSGWGVLI